MFTTTVKYTNFAGNERSQTVRFNLTKTELMRFVANYPMNLEAYISNMLPEEGKDWEQDKKMRFFLFFEELLRVSYGVLDEEGEAFIKVDPNTGKPMFDHFRQTAVYEALYDKITTSDEAAANFFNAILPPELRSAVKKASDEALLE